MTRLSLPTVCLLIGLSAHPWLIGCGPNHAQGELPTSAPSTPVVREVRASPPEPASREGSYPSNLYVERDVRVTARQSGIIEEIRVDRGASVREGDELALLETDVARYDLEMAKQDLRLKNWEYERMQRLHDDQVISPQDFERAKIARDLAASKADLSSARLERCSVRAPFDGVVIERWAVAGQRIREDDGTPLFRIAAKDPLRARVDLPEELVESVKTGTSAGVEAPGLDVPDARVILVGPATDPGSGTVPVIVELPAAPALRLGASVRVRFDGMSAGKANLFRLPREALAPGALREGDMVTVFVVSNRKAATRRVRITESGGDFVIVEGDLTPSEPVILGTQGSVLEGEPVEPARESGS